MDKKKKNKREKNETIKRKTPDSRLLVSRDVENNS